jgi:hypothetical protein
MVNRLKVLREGISAAKTMRDRTKEIKHIIVVFDDDTYAELPLKQALQMQIGDEDLLTLTVKLERQL